MKKLFAILLMVIPVTTYAENFDQYIGLDLQDFLDRTHYKPIRYEVRAPFTFYEFGYDRVAMVHDAQCDMMNSANMVRGYPMMPCPDKQTTVHCRWVFKVDLLKETILEYKHNNGC